MDPRLGGSDPVDHAAGWNDHLASDPAAYAEALDEWTSYFDGLGAGWISEGGVVMHRRAGDNHLVRADSVDEDELEYASDQIERVFRALAALARDGEAVLDGRLRLVEDARFDQELDRTGEVMSTTLVLDEGTCPDWELTLETAAVLVGLDGATTLEQAVARVARREDLSKRETIDLRSEARELARDLLEVGALEVA